MKGPSPEAVERINIAVLALLDGEPMTLGQWARACRPMMTYADFRSVRIRCMGARLTHMVDGRLRLTTRGYRSAMALSENGDWRWWR